MSKKYNHMLDIAFEIETDEKVWHNIPKSEIIAAVLKRVADIVREDTDLGETFSHLQTCEAEEHKDEYYESYPNKLPKLINEMEDTSTYSETMQDKLEPIDKE